MKTYLVSTQLIYLLFLLPWTLIWGISFMAFDGGVSLGAIALTLGIGIYPLVLIACSIVAWLQRNNRKRSAVFVNLIPMLWVLGAGVPMLIINL